MAAAQASRAGPDGFADGFGLRGRANTNAPAAASASTASAPAPALKLTLVADAAAHADRVSSLTIPELRGAPRGAIPLLSTSADCRVRLWIFSAGGVSSSASAGGWTPGALCLVGTFGNKAPWPNPRVRAELPADLVAADQAYLAAEEWSRRRKVSVGRVGPRGPQRPRSPTPAAVGSVHAAPLPDVNYLLAASRVPGRRGRGGALGVFGQMPVDGDFDSPGEIHTNYNWFELNTAAREDEDAILSVEALQPAKAKLYHLASKREIQSAAMREYRTALAAAHTGIVLPSEGGGSEAEGAGRVDPLAGLGAISAAPSSLARIYLHRIRGPEPVCVLSDAYRGWVNEEEYALAHCEYR
eukprot:c39912_g1_i1.p1 GENE.c39912_g1_i1~~c39912_g1_i1.p1  ORF type:complete len:381 (+),score=36.75 c39912_g1_i1:76-1143(+)